MKAKLVLLLSALLLGHTIIHAAPLGTLFTYQGTLDFNGQPANGSYQMTFWLYATFGGGSPLASNIVPVVPVNDALFTRTVDFGPGAFSGEERWLAITVATNGSTNFTLLSPRTRIAPAPQALYAATAGTVSVGAITATNLATMGIPGPNQVLGYNGGSLVWQSPGGVTSPWTQSGSIVYYSGGNVGIGSSTPVAPLDILGNWTGEQGALNLRGNRPSIRFTGDAASGNESWLLHLGGDGPGSLQFFRRTGPGAWANVMTLAAPSGNVGIGAIAPVSKFEVIGAASQTAVLGYSSGSIGVFGRSTSFTGVHGETASAAAAAVVGINLNTSGGQGVFGESLGSGVGVYGKSASFEGVHGETTSSTFAATVGINQGSGPGIYGKSEQGGYGGYFVGKVRVGVLEIAGGADLAEPFPMKEVTIEKGSVVVIDEEHPGRLKLSTHAYDTQVAGIISGANGINPGIALKQEGVLDQGQNVALTGRVYVQADATHGAIKPGDLLTTSDTPGHAMKVGDHTKSQGAILGKAMSALTEGTGLVLVLVTLQ